MWVPPPKDAPAPSGAGGNKGGRKRARQERRQTRKVRDVGLPKKFTAKFEGADGLVDGRAPPTKGTAFVDPPVRMW